jgi:hypothetical protein
MAMALRLVTSIYSWLLLLWFKVLCTVIRVVDPILWLYNRKLRRPVRISVCLSLSIVTSNSPAFSLFKPSESDAWDDSEIIRRTESSPYLPGSNDSLVQISSDTVVKFGGTFASSESLAMNYDHSAGDILIVMSFIPNARELRVCWSTLSLWKQLGIILAMRYYIRQLRRVRHPSSGTPGPPGTRPKVCYGLQFGYDPQGPFKTTDALAGYLHRLHDIAEYRHNNKFIPLNESLFSRLVFTHNDLNMRNILLDSEGRLWLIDWGFTGFFPPCFEYLAMLYTAQNETAPKGWQAAIKFMAEPSFEMERWMSAIGCDYIY